MLWLVLVGRALWPALQADTESRSLVALLFLSTVAIGLFYAAALVWGEHSHLSEVEYWRWWMVHLWVEGFFEVFATAVLHCGSGRGVRLLPSRQWVRNLRMPSDKNPAVLDPSQQREMALARWDNEGGAIPGRPQEAAIFSDEQSEIPELTNAELVHLRVRVIALENLVISLLAEATDRQLDLAREMAGYISPRPGFTQHPLTIHAASQMIGLVERAGQFRQPPPAAAPYKRTPIFDENSLPAGLRREHRTKPGVWGVIRVLDGRLRYVVMEPASEVILQPGHPGLVLPDQPHLVEPLGPMRMQVEFYNQLPDI